MFEYIESLITNPSMTITSVYGVTVEPDFNRKKRVEQLIKLMGDKYLLAKPIERKTDA